MPYSIKRLICFLAGIAHRILRHRTHHEKRPRNLADLQHSLGDAFSIVSKVKFGTVKVCFDVSLPEPLQADRAEHADSSPYLGRRGSLIARFAAGQQL